MPFQKKNLNQDLENKFSLDELILKEDGEVMLLNGLTFGWTDMQI